MVLAVRFRYHEAKTPTYDIVHLNTEQWREFFWLERSFMRMDWMLHFLNRTHEGYKYKEMWWIPLDDQEDLQIAPNAPIRKN